jgi:S1-C subfamily serine protease
VARLCPSIATVATGSGAAAGTNGATAFVVSADGWLLTSGTLVTGTQLQALFSNGEKVAIDEVRSDPVSGLSVAHANATALPPLSFSDQAFARVGDFGFSLQAPNGSGCSAQWAMIGGDFLGDANTKGVLIRLQSGSPPLAPGGPFFGDGGTVLGVASETQGGALLPGPIVASIVDELIRGTPSPIARFGFRAVDFSPDLATRVGNARARGAGVALIQPNSSADKTGLRAGDIIVAVDGSPVSSASELARDLDAEAAGAILQVARGDEQLQLKVVQSAD